MSDLTDKIKASIAEKIFTANIDKNVLSEILMEIAILAEAGGGGLVIPLSGTTVDNPVTGDIEIDSLLGSKKIYSQDENSTSGVIVSHNGTRIQSFDKDLADGSQVLVNTFSIEVYNVDEEGNPSKGITGSYDYTENVTDLDYPQVKFIKERGSEVNATTSVLSVSDLNTAYPNAKDGFSVICPNVIGGGKYYIKAGGGWVYQQLLTVV